MDSLVIKETEETPGVYFDASTASLNLSGKSYMEDVVMFYEPVLRWLREYGKAPKPETVFNFKMEYLNTSSSKVVLDILESLNDIHAKEGCEVKVRWFFFDEDEDIEEIGKEYSELNGLPFEFVAMEYED